MMSMTILKVMTVMTDATILNAIPIVGLGVKKLAKGSHTLKDGGHRVRILILITVIDIGCSRVDN